MQKSSSPIPHSRWVPLQVPVLIPSSTARDSLSLAVSRCMENRKILSIELQESLRREIGRASGREREWSSDVCSSDLPVLIPSSTARDSLSLAVSRCMENRKILSIELQESLRR